MKKSLMLTAAISGLMLGGVMTGCANTDKSGGNGCKGANGCKGGGSCKTEKASCNGEKASCNGEKASCKTK